MRSTVSGGIKTVNRLDVEGVSKQILVHGQLTSALFNVNMNVKRSEFVSLLGPRGCGKSTLLKIITGLDHPTTGRILVDGQMQSGVNRRLAYIPQQDDLLPWRNVLSNTELALELRGIEKSERRRSAKQWISKVGLQGFERHYPHEISECMRKQVALARTLAYDPEILLLDDPFSAVDAQTKIVLEEELLKLWQENGKTILFATHDLAEAVAISDRIFLMKAHPGTIKNVVEVDLIRPRRIVEIQHTAEYAQIYRSIWNSLEEDVRKSMLLQKESPEYV